jgi:hypothetical protein
MTEKDLKFIRKSFAIKMELLGIDTVIDKLQLIIEEDTIGLKLLEAIEPQTYNSQKAIKNNKVNISISSNLLPIYKEKQSIARQKLNQLIQD